MKEVGLQLRRESILAIELQESESILTFEIEQNSICKSNQGKHQCFLLHAQKPEWIIKTINKIVAVERSNIVFILTQGKSHLSYIVSQTGIIRSDYIIWEVYCKNTMFS